MVAFVTFLPLQCFSSTNYCGLERNIVHPSHRRTYHFSSSRQVIRAVQVSPAVLSSPDRSQMLSRRSTCVVVWFRPGDLRVRDHPGLLLALNECPGTLACLYVWRGQPWEEPVIRGLRQALRAHGGELFVRDGVNGEGQAVLDFMQEINARKVFVRRSAVGFDDLEVVRSSDAVDTVQWGEDVWGERWLDGDDEMPEDFGLFLKWKRRRARGACRSEGEPEEEMLFLFPGTPEGIEQSDVHNNNVSEPNLGDVSLRLQQDSERLGLLTLHFDEKRGISDKDGEKLVRNYLEAMERYERMDFGRTFMPIFKYGLVSPRRLEEIVVQFERENGRLWPFFYREAAKIILRSLESREFHCKLAYRDVSTRKTVDGLHGAKYWNWNGYVARYIVEGNPSKPALLLTHGFGASSQHWRGNVAQLCRQYQVYCIDLIGFGRSEKPRTTYTQYLWECFIRDFVLEVIRRKTYIAGNSIGGYMAMAFASDHYPDLCSGAILINPAGKLEHPRPDGGGNGIVVRKRKQKGLVRYLLEEYRFARMALGHLLFAYLQRGIESTLKRVYPVNPNAANKELAAEIYRNSQDRGAVEILASGFILPDTRSLGSLLRDYKGPLLIYSGKYDPLSRPLERAEKMKMCCPQAQVKIVEAGHCPHDEFPEQFNETLIKWITRVEQKTSPTVAKAKEGINRNGTEKNLTYAVSTNTRRGSSS